MDNRMPNGLVSKNNSFGEAAESAALAVATASIKARLNAENRVFIISPSWLSCCRGSMRRRLRNDLRLLRRLRGVVNHRVGVFDPHAVSAALLFENAHERVVMFFVFPIALPFEQGGNGG